MLLANFVFNQFQLSVERCNEHAKLSCLFEISKAVLTLKNENVIYEILSLVEFIILKYINKQEHYNIVFLCVRM